MVAKDIKIDRIETTYEPDTLTTTFHSTVFATDADTLEAVVLTVDYDDAEGLEAAILASPTVDGGSIVDFLP